VRRCTRLPTANRRAASILCWNEAALPNGALLQKPGAQEERPINYRTLRVPPVTRCPVLRSLRIQNFRALEDFRVPRLGRVNLIVGKNNSGKSTILEALRIYAQNANPVLLDEILVTHDEMLQSLTQGAPSSEDDEHVPYENFFTGRNFPDRDDDDIYIGDGDGHSFVRIAHTFYREEESPVASDTGLPSIRRIPVPKDAVDEDASQALLISSSRREQPRWMPIGSGRTGVRRGRTAIADPAAVPLGFVPTGFPPSESLADLWDSVALTNYDAVIRDGLKIIEPRVEGIAFVKRDGTRYRADDRAPIVKLMGSERPVPLNSMGDGMLRILQLLLSLVPAKGGVYLVDEFENGLHYSVQERVWELVFELAARNGVQVFAATHSWDCIEAFKRVGASRKGSAVLFRVGRSVRASDKGKAIATVFGEDELAQLTQADMEVR
jgi:energy-coupling factor transporter ATP-binding protein EcfA2